jgi:parvulin-like peptidyl-prolyl isomerase
LARASEAARIELATLLARAKAGESFADLAREASEDLATRDEGGRRPGRFRADSVPQALADAVLAQPVGGTTGPLLYGSAWVAFHVLERRKVSYEDSKAELAEELRVERPFLTDIGSYRNKLARDVQVRILPGMSR